jgi:hypothetical protein
MRERYISICKNYPDLQGLLLDIKVKEDTESPTITHQTNVAGDNIQGNEVTVNK